MAKGLLATCSHGGSSEASTGIEMELNFDTITTGKGIQMDLDALTSGTGLEIRVDSDIVTTGKAINVLSGASMSTSVFSVDEDGDVVAAGGLAMAGNSALGSRTSGSGVDLGTYEEGLLVAAQFEDSATLINTTDYVGCAGIFNLHMNRTSSGSGYGFATVWSNLEMDKAHDGSGGLSAYWGTLWMDAATGSSEITGTCHLQVADFAIVTGTDFNLGTGTKLYGIRIDSSINASITNSGTICGIIIEKSSGKLDWPVGIDINNCTTSLDIGVSTTGILMTGITGDAISIVTSGRIAVGTQGSGLPVTTTNPHLVQVHTLPVVALDAYTSSFGLRSRYEISTNQTNNVTIHAIDGRFRPKANIATGIFAGVCGYVEGSNTWTYGGSTDSVIAAGLFTVELDSTATLTTGRVIGVGIDSASAGDTTVTNCTYTGLRIWTGSSKEPWTYGITVDDCVTGMLIADSASVMSTGINISAPTTTGIYISGYAPTGIRVGGVCNASIANLKSLYLETTVGNSGVLTGYMTGIHIETYVGSVPTVPEHYGILVQTYSDLAGNQDIFPLRLDHNGVSVAYSFISLQGSPRYFVQSANTAEAWCNNTAVTASTGGGWLRVRLGGTTRYINLYSDTPS